MCRWILGVAIPRDAIRNIKKAGVTPVREDQKIAAAAAVPLAGCGRYDEKPLHILIDSSPD